MGKTRAINEQFTGFVINVNVQIAIFPHPPFIKEQSPASKNNDYQVFQHIVIWREFLTPGQDCMQCGTCCEKWGWDQKGVIEDIIPWIQEKRRDILQHVSIKLTNGKWCNGRDISLQDLPDVVRIDYWVDPGGRALTYCPFFSRAAGGKVYCRIHDTKPKVCIGFTPWNEGIRDYALNCPACRNSAP